MSQLEPRQNVDQRDAAIQWRFAAVMIVLLVSCAATIAIAKLLEARGVVSQHPRQLSSIAYFHCYVFGLVAIFLTAGATRRKLLQLTVWLLLDGLLWGGASLFNGKRWAGELLEPLLLNMFSHRFAFVTLFSVSVLLLKGLWKVRLENALQGERSFRWPVPTFQISLRDNFLLMTLAACLYLSFWELPRIAARGVVGMEIHYATTAYLATCSAIRAVIGWGIAILLLNGSRFSLVRFVGTAALLLTVAVTLKGAEAEAAPYVLDVWTNMLGLDFIMPDAAPPISDFSMGAWYPIFGNALLMVTCLMVLAGGKFFSIRR